MKRFTKTTCFFLITLFCFLQVMAQDDKAGRISPKELSIPAAPVFDLMGVTPAQVTRTSDIKDFKVDWTLKSYKLSPNFAIQSQPVWELLYNRKELDRYQRASRFMRRLSTLDVSIGTVQNENNNDRRIGIALKMTVFDKNDPLMAKDIYSGISEKYGEEKNNLEQQLKDLGKKLDTTKNILEKPDIRGEIKSTEDQLLSINSRRREEINSRAKIFVDEHWNSSSLEVAVGKINTYQTDAEGSFKTLRLNRSTGWGAWLNGSLGLGKKILLSGLFRSSWYEEEVNFTMRNKTTLEETQEKAVSDNTIFTMGLNLRYGGSIYTFFVEMLYERKSLRTPMEALNNSFKPGSEFEVVGSSVQWDVVHPNSINFGGDWRISRNVILNYGMRSLFDSKWKCKSFTPIVSVACMMR